MTTIHPTFHHAAAMARAAAPPHAVPDEPGPPRNGAQPTADFHRERVGAQRLMPRAAAAGAAGAPRHRQPPARSARQLERALAQALVHIDSGGDLGHFMDESGHDPLEQYTLLRELAQQHPRARQAADALCAALEQKHGAALLDASEGQERCAAAVGEIDRQAGIGTGKDDGHDGPVLARLQQRLMKGAEAGGATVADHALALARDMAAAGAGSLAARLGRLRQQAGADPVLRRAALHGGRLWMSLRQAHSFLLLESCLHQGAQLHARLAQAGMLAPGHDPDSVGLGLLSASGIGHGQELADKVGVRGGDAARARQWLAEAVRALPQALWSGHEARRKLLASLDDAAAGLLRHGGEARLEHDLRTRLEKRHA